MSQSSERLVFFVTPAQKRVLAARAERLGISLSELVRRAVLAFDETGEEVRAAGLVDRLGAAPSQIADSDRLRRLAAGASTGSGPSAKTEPAADAAGLAAAAPSRDGAAAPGEEDETGQQSSPTLPVAAAVARALACEAVTRPDEPPEPDDEAVVARVIANESGDLSRF